MTTEIRTSYSPSRMHHGMHYGPPPYMREHSPARAIIREHSRSPVRNEIHTGPPIVDKVFEKSTVIGSVATEEQSRLSTELCHEAESMRVRMNDYSNLVDNLRALQADFNLLTEENRLRKSEFMSRADASGALVTSVKQELED